MRPINALLSPVKQEILGATFGDPDRWWFLSEIAARAKRTPSSLQRDLRLLAESGLLEAKRDGARLYFKADRSSPLFEPVKEIVTRSLGITEELRSAVIPIEGSIEALFVYGSVARGEERAGSDVDIISIGDAGLSEMARVLRPLEDRFRREFNIRCYSVAEFRDKTKAGNHFLTSILREPKIFILGSDDELGRISE